MKFLSDLNVVEATWLQSSFANGRRHLDKEEFPTYFYAGTVHGEDNNLFSYAVSKDNGRNVYGVVEAPGRQNVGLVYDGSESQITFLDEDMLQGATDVFGSSFVGISVLDTEDNGRDVVIFYESDFPDVHVLSEQDAHTAVVMRTISILFNRVNPLAD